MKVINSELNLKVHQAKKTEEDLSLVSDELE